MELPQLLDCVKTNTFPERFLTRGLGLSPAALERLPDCLLGFMGLYLLCGLITVFLRFKRDQRSINSFAKQVINVILTTCCILMVPLLPMLVKAIPWVIQNEVPPLQGFDDLFRYCGDCFGKTFYLIMAVGALAATIWLPLGGALTYLKRYKFFGLPHMILDYGTGAYLICAFLLSSYHGHIKWYLSLVPAVVLLRVVQAGGYVPEEVNTRAAVTGRKDETS